LYAAVASKEQIDVARIDDGVQYVTRTAGAAIDPAPAPDGSLYFMSLEPDGFVVRKLAEPQPLGQRPTANGQLYEAKLYRFKMPSRIPLMNCDDFCVPNLLAISMASSIITNFGVSFSYKNS